MKWEKGVKRTLIGYGLAAGALLFGGLYAMRVNESNLRGQERARLEPRIGIERVIEETPKKDTPVQVQERERERIVSSQVYDNGFDENMKWLFDTYLTVERHEGKRNWVYDDATGERLRPGDICKGNRTVGVGFNLERDGAREKIEQLGLDYDTIYNGERPLTDEQIRVLFRDYVNRAVDDSRMYLPNFDEHPDEVKKVIVDMAFNLGYGGLSGFKRMRQALIQGDYQRAADEMENSRWYYQVGNRSRELVRMMRSIREEK